MAAGGGGKSDDFQPFPVKDQLPGVDFCVSSSPNWRMTFRLHLPFLLILFLFFLHYALLMTFNLALLPCFNNRVIVVFLLSFRFRPFVIVLAVYSFTEVRVNLRCHRSIFAIDHRAFLSSLSRYFFPSLYLFSLFSLFSSLFMLDETRKFCRINFQVCLV